MDVELQTNMLAAYANSGQPFKAIKFVSSLPETDMTYELAYNAACALIDAGDAAAAMKKLDEVHQSLRLSHS